jgi:hypothetical protein
MVPVYPVLLNCVGTKLAEQVDWSLETIPPKEEEHVPDPELLDEQAVPLEEQLVTLNTGHPPVQSMFPDVVMDPAEIVPVPDSVFPFLP